jgi:hypothetical protein
MPTSDLVARYEEGRPRPKPLILDLPSLLRDRFAVKPAQIPLGQLKRRPYNPAVALRPQINLSRLFAGADLPENQQYVTRATQERQGIMESLQRAMTVPRLQYPMSVAGNRSTSQPVGGSFGKLVAAIRGKESGGNYRAVNRHSGALGAYQIMPGNLGPWSREILGRTVSRSEFLSNPSLQDAIATGKLRQYYQKYGAAGAATAWYAGPGAVSKKMGSTKAQGQYPSIQSYWQSILRMM